MAARIIVRVDLTPPANNAIGKLMDRFGMTQVTLMSKLVKWFARQPDGIQSSVVSPLAATQADSAKLILQHMASGKSM